MKLDNKPSFESFIYPVNQAGLPLNSCISGLTGQSSLRLTAQEVAKIYWMLRCIDIHYSYQVNGVEYHRDHHLETTIRPKERAYWVPSFSKSGTYDNGVDYLINFDLSRFMAWSDKAYSLEWSLIESDHDFRYTLSTHPEPDGKILDVFLFDFLGQKQPCTLCALDSYTSGAIVDFSLNLGF